MTIGVATSTAAGSGKRHWPISPGVPMASECVEDDGPDPVLGHPSLSFGQVGGTTRRPGQDHGDQNRP